MLLRNWLYSTRLLCLNCLGSCPSLTCQYRPTWAYATAYLRELTRTADMSRLYLPRHLQGLQCCALSTIFKQLQVSKHLRLRLSQDNKVCRLAEARHQHLAKNDCLNFNAAKVVQPLLEGRSSKKEPVKNSTTSVLQLLKTAKADIQDSDDQKRL